MNQKPDFNHVEIANGSMRVIWDAPIEMTTA